MSANPDRALDDSLADRQEGSSELAGLAALALLLRDREQQARLEEAAAGAIARGHSLAVISALTMPSSDQRARFEAMGRLAAACARLADVQDLLMKEAGALGGEMPVERNAEFQRAMSRARFQMHVVIRVAVLRGEAPRAILEIALAAGLDLEEGDLTRAFELQEVPRDEGRPAPGPPLLPGAPMPENGREWTIWIRASTPSTPARRRCSPRPATPWPGRWRQKGTAREPPRPVRCGARARWQPN